MTTNMIFVCFTQKIIPIRFHKSCGLKRMTPGDLVYKIFVVNLGISHFVNSLINNTNFKQ